MFGVHMFVNQTTISIFQTSGLIWSVITETLLSQLFFKPVDTFVPGHHAKCLSPPYLIFLKLSSKLQSSIICLALFSQSIIRAISTMILQKHRLYTLLLITKTNNNIYIYNRIFPSQFSKNYYCLGSLRM